MPTTAEMSNTLRDKLVPEDHAIQVACADLEVSPASTDLRKLLATGEEAASPQATKRAVATLRAELVAGLGSLFELVKADVNACKPEVLLAAKLGNTAPPAACTKVLDDALGAARAPADTAAHRVRAALKKAGFSSAKAIIDDPVGAARLIDLSPALVSASLELSEGAERLAEDIASNFSWGKGLVKMGLTLAAAEIVAWSFDRVVDEMETKNLVNPASIARTACGLHDRGGRGLVASRVLKRAIMRTAREQWTTQPYPMDGFCKDFSKYDACSTMRDQAFTKSDPAAEKSRPLEPTLNAEFDWSAKTLEVITKTVEKVSEATAMCQIPNVDQGEAGQEIVTYTDTPCDFQFLNRVASILLLYNIKATHENRQAVEKEVKGLRDHLDKRLNTLDERVGRLQASGTVLQNSIEQLSANGSTLDHKNHEMLARLLDCTEARADARWRRAKFADAAMGLCAGPSASPLCTIARADKADVGKIAEFCAGDMTAQYERKLPSGSALVVTGAGVCDVSGTTFAITLQTDRAFGPCGTELKKGTADDLANMFGRAAFRDPKTSLLIVGHADEQQLGDDCTSRMGTGGEDGNELLSKERAATVAGLLAKTIGETQVPGAPTRFSSTGRGSSEPLQKHCSALQTEQSRKDCHAKNRRVSFVVSRPADFGFAVLDCRELAPTASKFGQPSAPPQKTPATVKKH